MASSTSPDHVQLSRRERQIMDIIFAAREASATQVLAALPDPPSYSAVRALLRILEEKGHLKHKRVGAKYVYLPTRQRGSAAKSALRRVMTTFFDNSAAKAVATLLDSSDSDLSDVELDELANLIDKAKRRERRQP